ncbi:hypothetical protein I302_102139 [Kwoniella bestiolae CBS 10118]|uniref:Major facilitator superfamily (MFS) profile domain-containing protein n=1 Tax=Kwoniella bestiolae CBS 10118 TaxID=1296100 RepID=A0A1B9GE74_9TREE|nr:hypothetical protein I302_00828 [Kwoniella bestiolae CBS 10118]OCF29326.1 hypothetical protein I302_00828 [Kwoniella bestiolae CBS 10118]
MESKGIVKIVFLALVLDLLAFTIPLPLFPRLTAWYLHLDSSPDSLLSKLLLISRKWRSTLLSFSSSSSEQGLGVGAGKKEWDVVLLGGAMGSLFSFCQCLISPWLGRLSDKHGRKRVLLATMMGNILSALIWIQSTSFASFLLSRLVGGLSEGNVQLSTAIISDVTTSSTRSRSLALVGIAFSICFTLGPSLGAYFASQPLPLTSPSSENRFNIYALPATISLVLLLVETLYLAAKLPETKGWKKAQDDTSVAGKDKKEDQVTLLAEERSRKLNVVGRLHGLFLLFFSGAEFTLTFLTYDLFQASNAQNGRLLSYIGILSALLQARHVRPSLARLGELRVASRGILSCVLALSLLSILPLSPILSSRRVSTAVLYASATCLSYTSATVVTGLTASAASLVNEQERGKALGGFRSKGQLGRAVGPLLASSIYWVNGPTVTYASLAVCLVGVYALARAQVDEKKKEKMT